MQYQVSIWNDRLLKDDPPIHYWIPWTRDDDDIGMQLCDIYDGWYGLEHRLTREVSGSGFLIKVVEVLYNDGV